MRGHGLELWLCVLWTFLSGPGLPTHSNTRAAHPVPCSEEILLLLLNQTAFNILHKNAHFGQKHFTADYRCILLDLIKKSAKRAMVVLFKNAYQLEKPTEEFSGKMTRCLACTLNSSQRGKKKCVCACVWGREER